MFQQATLLPWQTVLQNVMLPIRTLGMDIKQGEHRARALLRLVGLEKFERHYPHELSGGMQQRVGIARGLLLLMDEPFAALDALSREHMMVELQRIWVENRKSVIFITHPIPEAVFFSTKIIFLSPRPAKIIREIDVDLPLPRNEETMASARFTALCTELRHLFFKQQH